MLFNSFTFILGFLPIALAGYWVASRFAPIGPILWLALCSLAFYGYWSPDLLLLILGSIAFNFTMGEAISRLTPGKTRRWIFRAAVTGNLLGLGIFKYLAPVVNFVAGHFALGMALSIVLPLGISFFTFTQIGYLVDRRDGVGERLDFLRYVVFVTFFPHLIAGPILHIREIGPQLRDSRALRLTATTFAPGLTMFVIGLSKKVLLADPLSAVVETAFSDPHKLTLLSAPVAVVAYSIQIYFDFSGYSDMAIGLAGMFGLKFPLNFDSPYKARSIIDFWQRWHMTLSRYLGLLLYNPVAMWVTRQRVARKLKMTPAALAKPRAFLTMVAMPTFYTMGLAGIWHGAGLQFVLWGLLHAAYLTINHAWRLFWKIRGVRQMDNEPFAPRHIWKVGLTYVAVLAGFVFFRADSVPDAVRIFRAILGFNGLGFSTDLASGLRGALGMPVVPVDHAGIVDRYLLLRIAVSLAVIWSCPNSQQIMGRFAPITDPVDPSRYGRVAWNPSIWWAALTATALFTCLLNFSQSTTFLYFQF